MTIYLVVKSYLDNELYCEIESYKTLEEATDRLDEIYNNLSPTDGDLEIDYDEEEGTLSYIDADVSCKVYVCVEQTYLDIENK